MNDRILAKTITRALLTVLADLTPRTDEARQLVALLLSQATIKAVGGCPVTALEVAKLLFEVKSEIEAEAAGTAVPLTDGIGRELTDEEVLRYSPYIPSRG